MSCTRTCVLGIGWIQIKAQTILPFSFFNLWCAMAQIENLKGLISEEFLHLNQDSDTDYVLQATFILRENGIESTSGIAFCFYC